ncbi:M14 family metallopeptidase [Candidatus Uabimicrobium sp. HlEnr_7]|uniref:M14 family metallopeptidase n=1 Tax=Candidatus Uabimicrobium helgolandensis TaxID=3095367 RepID=UPI00355733DF
MYKILLLSFILLSGIFAENHYSMVEIYIHKDNAEKIASLPFAMECTAHEHYTKTDIIRLPLTPTEITKLDKSNISYKIIIENLSEFYAQRNHQDLADAQKSLSAAKTEMKLGSMGGYFTVEEVTENLDYLFKKYSKKNLITAKKSIGKTVNGRDIYMVKISDNATKNEQQTEAQIMYTAAHHACEPAGLMTVFYFMYYILENYETDKRVRSIVDNRELFFIPLVNPDGYAYNQKTNPNGGGLWRKNRNKTGVDLNRNYGPKKYWNYKNKGSSDDPSEVTYRGTQPFSENETQAIRNFVATKNIRLNLNYHAFGNVVYYPWAHKDVVASPHCLPLMKELTRVNGYSYGSSDKMIYPIRGDADDWLLETQNILSVTPEVGGWWDGFWPSPKQIFRLAKQNIDANLSAAEYVDQLDK